MSITHALHAELHTRADAWRRERAHEQLAKAGLVPAREPAARQAAQALASLVLDWLDAGGMLTAMRPDEALPNAERTNATATLIPLLTEPPTRRSRRMWARWTSQHRLSQRFSVRAGLSPQRAADAAAPAGTTVATQLPPSDREPAPKEAPRDAASPATRTQPEAPTALHAPEPEVPSVQPVIRPAVDTPQVSTLPPSERATPPGVKPPHHPRVAEVSTPSKTPGPPPSAASLQDLAARFKPAGAKARASKPSVTIQLTGALRPLSPDWAPELRAMLDMLGSTRAADAAQRLVTVAEDPRWIAFPDEVLGVFLHFLVARCRAAQSANPIPYVHARLDKAFDILRKAQQRHISGTFVHGMQRGSTPQRADNWSGEAEHYRQKLEAVLDPAEAPIGRVQRLEARLPDDVPGFLRALKNARDHGAASDPTVLGIVDRHAHLVTDPDLAPMVAEARRWRAQRETTDAHAGRDTLWADVVRECTALVLLPSARESFLDSPYRAPEHMAACLRAVNQVATRWKTALEQNASMGEGLREAFKALGYTYKPSISDETRGKYGDQYRWPWGDDLLLFEEHITEAGGHDANRCFSLHFRFDKERRAVAVAHAGRHRQNTLS
jgi:hypothetical protein